MVLGAARRRQYCDIFLPRELRWTKTINWRPTEGRIHLSPDRALTTLSQCNTSSYVDMLVLYVRFLIPIWVLKYFAAFSAFFHEMKRTMVSLPVVSVC